MYKAFVIILVALFAIALVDINAFHTLVGVLGNTATQMLVAVLGCESLVFLIIIAGLIWYFWPTRRGA